MVPLFTVLGKLFLLCGAMQSATDVMIALLYRPPLGKMVLNSFYTVYVDTTMGFWCLVQ